MELTFDAATEPEIILYAASFDLLEQEQFNVSQRPLDQMSMPFVLNDAVLRKRTLKLSKDFRQPNDDVTYELVEPNAE